MLLLLSWLHATTAAAAAAIVVASVGCGDAAFAGSSAIADGYNALL